MKLMYTNNLKPMRMEIKSEIFVVQICFIKM